MSDLLDLRPRGVDLLLRPSTTVTVTLEWPDGALSGRTFTSTLDGTALDLAIVGDTMTVTAPVDVTDDLVLGTPVVWLLSEELGGVDPEPVLVGVWTPSDAAAVVQSTTVEVTEGAATVTVTAAAAGLLSSGREVAGPSQMTANSDPFNADTNTFQMEDVLVSGGGALYHEITVPADGLRPVYLELDTSVQIDTAGEAVTLAIAPSGTASPTIITDAIQHRTKTLPASGQNEHLGMRVRLAAGVSGSYKIMGSVTGGNGTVAAASFGPSILSAIES